MWPALPASAASRDLQCWAPADLTAAAGLLPTVLLFITAQPTAAQGPASLGLLVTYQQLPCCQEHLAPPFLFQLDNDNLGASRPQGLYFPFRWFIWVSFCSRIFLFRQIHYFTKDLKCDKGQGESKTPDF